MYVPPFIYWLGKEYFLVWTLCDTRSWYCRLPLNIKVSYGQASQPPATRSQLFGLQLTPKGRSAPRSSFICIKYNKYGGDCKYGTLCHYKHICSSCKGITTPTPSAQATKHWRKRRAKPYQTNWYQAITLKLTLSRRTLLSNLCIFSWSEPNSSYCFRVCITFCPVICVCLFRRQQYLKILNDSICDRPRQGLSAVSPVFPTLRL